MNSIRIIGVASSVIVILLSAPIAFAENQSESGVQGVNATRTKPIEVRKARMATTTRAEIKDTVRAKMEATREEMKVRTETVREKAKQRLSDIRDNRKQQMALRLAEQFDKLNQKWTDHFMQQLDHYDVILLKIQDRAAIASSTEKNIASTTAAVQLARTVIASARAAVIAQAAKTYTLNTPSLTTTMATTTTSGQNELIKALRTAFQNMHKALFNDLFALRDGAMKNTRAALQSALKTLSQTLKVDDDDDSTDDSD